MSTEFRSLRDRLKHKRMTENPHYMRMDYGRNEKGQFLDHSFDDAIEDERVQLKMRHDVGTGPYLLCDGCSQKLPASMLHPWPYLPILLCVDCTMDRRKEIGDE